jgi:hypothetical protein
MKYYKYPRTYHLPWSPGKTDDDKVISDVGVFANYEVVITEKMDGENTTMYNDNIHARSIDGRNHWTRNWVKNLHGQIKANIPNGFRICGENCFAKHSIKYDSLDTYFYGFSIWNEDTCLSWDETLEYFSLLNIAPVRVLYRGPFSVEVLFDLQNQIDFNIIEGYVVRNTAEFKLSQFKNNVCKFVRKNHIKTTQHWMHNIIETNKLAGIHE